MENFNSIFPLLELQYGIEMDDLDIIDTALIGWNKIGNKHFRMYRFRGIVDPKDHSVKLPCNCNPEDIEAVTYDFEDWNYTDNLRNNGNMMSGFTEHYIEGRKHFTDSFYQSGKFVKYDPGLDRIYIHDSSISEVNILYKGVLMDDEQLPYISNKEAEALACYVAYTQKFKQGWQTNNSLTILMAQMLEQRWLKLCDAARVRQLNQNDMNEILDVKTSYGRKFYGKSLKPIK